MPYGPACHLSALAPTIWDKLQSYHNAMIAWWTFIIRNVEHFCRNSAPLCPLYSASPTHFWCRQDTYISHRSYSTTSIIDFSNARILFSETLFDFTAEGMRDISARPITPSKDPCKAHARNSDAFKFAVKYMHILMLAATMDLVEMSQR